jgi:HNH endonuclease
MAKGDHRYRRSLWDRFHDKVMPEPNTGCWLWVGAIKEHGYGVIGLGRRDEGTAKAHRVSWELHRRKLQPGECVLHHCDQPLCVNPNHLFCGTLSDNMKDCARKGRNFLPNNRGTNAKWAKLDAQKVAEIRSRRESGAEYARRFNVSRSAIYEIWRGKNWAWT